MSDANRTAVRLVDEAELGVTPDNPALKAQRVTNVALSYAPSYTESEELDPTQQVADMILVGFESGGGWDFELSFGAQDDLMAKGLRSTWSARATATAGEVSAVDGTGETYTTSAVSPAWADGMLVLAAGFADAANNGVKHAIAGSTATSLAVSEDLVEDATPTDGVLRAVGFEAATGDAAYLDAGKTLTISATSGDWTDLGLVAGEWVRVTGFSTCPDGWARIASVTATVITFDIVPASFVDDAGAGDTVSIWFGDYIRNGVTLAGFSIEEEYEDLATPEFQYYLGMAVDTLSFSMPNKSRLTGNVVFAGLDVEGPTTTRAAGATTVAAPSGRIYNTSSNVGRLLVDGAVIGTNYVLEASLEIANSLRRKPAVANLGDIGLGLGTCRVTGQLQTYYADKSFLEKLRSDTAASYMTQLTDPDGGRGYLIDLPRLKFTDGDPDVPGRDDDRTLPLDFTATKHATLGYTAHFARYHYFE